MKPIDWEEDQNGCWICTSHRRNYYPNGYPQLTGGKLISRHIWAECFGEIPAGMCICHKCDNPGCINPEHLFIATHKENMYDMAKKKRKFLPMGVLNKQAKINPDQVVEIIGLRNHGHTQKEVAEVYGISKSMVSLIDRKKNWKSVTNIGDSPSSVGSNG